MEAIIKGDKGTVGRLGIELLLLALLGIAAGIANTIFSARAALNISTKMRGDIYHHVQKFAFADIEQFAASNLVVRMTNDINQVQGMVMQTLQIVARVPIMFAGALILAIMTIPEMWWLILLMIVIIVAIAWFGMTTMSHYFGEVQGYIDQVNTIARENLMGVRVVKSFNQEANQEKEFAGASDKMTKVSIKIGYAFSMMMPGFFTFANLAVAGAIFLVGHNITDHPENLAAIASFVGYMMQLLMAVINAGFIATGATRAFVSLGRIGEVLQHKPSMQFKDVPETELEGSIEFDHVTFSYPGEKKPTLRDVSFKVAPGEMVGIVGATGAGKSTLAQLIPRLFDPEAGVVRVGSQNVKDVAAATMRKTIGMVLQRATLFSGTIAQNLRQGKPDATVTDMRWAAEVAQSEEFIRRLDGQFDAEVEERSANFSGGQKQRLAITRGVIGKPNILIMDDSTSALDARSERLVQEALARELQGMTTVIIAEKISSIIKADRILVMDKGRVVASGTHEQLLDSSPIYREIYTTQKAREGRTI
jgi:ATP-binding cassette subfamily B multidrug efflux pump